MEERLIGLEKLIHYLDCNIKMLEYISFDLHNETFSLNNNIGLLWVWKSLLESQILEFYKLNIPTEKYSFQKIHNLLSESKAKIDYKQLLKLIKNLKQDFDKNQFDIIRSKYLAHLDIGAPEAKTDLVVVREFTYKAINIFLFIFSEIKRQATEFSNDVLNSFKEIFKRIDEYEKVSAYLMVAELNGEKTIEIEKLGVISKE
jgi:hypothetical protein